MNFQYAKGMSTIEALKFLYAEGGIRRFYRGVAPALIQGPLSRFGAPAPWLPCLPVTCSGPQLTSRTYQAS